ncbi:hypothetical protein [Usitatibacter palustris]|uniref:Lipid-binding SYLF domain-containing protein n=1 Tax=Usitatibacter palustris TaxID=2732487 RepID=A0A6M4HA73_9PROT|nr:hypothetical protein [Usitatibacter palustris]QJR14947.1 hypothetical protein DSM104440_01762 [Usitatibacter palustris]
MKTQAATKLLIASLAVFLASCATGAGDSVDKRRDALRKIHDETLVEFYKTKPEIKAELEAAVGYGVFDGSQVNVVLFVGSLGAGVLVDNKDKKETFMKLARAGTGPGVGYKSYRQLLVFKDRTLFDAFRTVGADVGASADATMKTKATGGVSLDGSVSFNPLLSVYQYTERGALLQANWGGVAYLPDEELNAPPR